MTRSIPPSEARIVELRQELLAAHESSNNARFLAALDELMPFLLVYTVPPAEQPSGEKSGDATELTGDAQGGPTLIGDADVVDALDSLSLLALHERVAVADGRTLQRTVATLRAAFLRPKLPRAGQPREPRYPITEFIDGKLTVTGYYTPTTEEHAEHERRMAEVDAGFYWTLLDGWMVPSKKLFQRDGERATRINRRLTSG